MNRHTKLSVICILCGCVYVHTKVYAHINAHSQAYTYINSCVQFHIVACTHYNHVCKYFFL